VSIRFISIIYFLLIFLMSILPINGIDKLENVVVLSFRGDYWIHAIQFIPFLVVSRFLKINFATSFFWGLFCVASFEGIQWFLPYRSFNISDLVANFTGLVAGGVLIPFNGHFKLILKRFGVE